MSKKSIRKKLGKRVYINLTAMNLVAEGFSTRRARKWALKEYKLKKRASKYSRKEIKEALDQGFFPMQLEKLKVSTSDYNQLITAKDYELLGSLNGRIGKRMSNKMGVYKKFRSFRTYLPKYYYSAIRTKGKLRVRPLYDEYRMVVSVEDMLETLRKEETLRVRNLRGRASNLLAYKEGNYFIDEKEIEKDELVQLLENCSLDYVVTEDVKPKTDFTGMVLRVLVLNDKDRETPHIGNAELLLSVKDEIRNPLLVPTIDGDEEAELDYIEQERVGKYHASVNLETGEIGDMIRIHDGDTTRLELNPNNEAPLPQYVPMIDELHQLIESIAFRYKKTFTFFGLEFIVTNEGFKIMRVLNHPDYPCTIPFDEEISNALKEKVMVKRLRFESPEIQKNRKKRYIKTKLKKRRMRRKGNKNKMQFKKIIRRLYINYVSVKLVSKGYITREAKRWAKETYRLKHTNQNRYSKEEVESALSRGFLPSQVKRMEKAGAYYDGLISAKDYSYLSPINGGYSKWINDRITMNAIFKPYRDVMPKCYYQIYKRDTETAIIPLYDFNAGRTFDDLLQMVKEKGTLRVRRAKGSRSKILAYVDGKYYLGKHSFSKTKLIEELSSYESVLIVTENVTYHPAFYGAKLRLTVFNEQGDNPVIGDAALVYYKPENDDDLFIEKEFEAVAQRQSDGVATVEEDATDEDSVEEDVNVDIAEVDDDDDADDFCVYVDPKTGKISEKMFRLDGSTTFETTNPNNGETLLSEIPGWDKIVKRIDSLCRFAPQLEYFGVDIIITEDGFKIMQMSNHPVYPTRIPFSAETSAYLKRKVVEKQAAYTKTKTRKQRGFKKIKLKIRAWYAKTFFPKGLKPYLSIRIFQDMKKDFLTNRDTTLKQKIWAIKHGFVSYRIPQYGITEENHLNFISDFEYKWLRHINNKYRVWMEDKITVKYICSEYNSCFPEYYYHISLKNGSNRIIPMMDCPSEYGNEFEDIVKLVHEKGALALKPDEGSHGDGFYKFSYEEGKYYLNHEEASLDDVRRILNDVNNQYLVTEYINMHQEIKRIYDGAVNTIRMIVFKKDGVNPVIGNAYMRFGSKRTGAVDNMGAGGMFAQIDIDTGRFYNAKIIEANEIKPCLHHPDTGVMIDGYLPNWEKVKQDVLNVARNIPQLEYFGFDLALTEDGLKFPEINRFPDYPAIEKYTPQTIDYLLYKLEQKKKKYGYDIDRGKQLIKLPKR